jgi:RNA polymerase sigma-70 factor (ECF subfamily)
MAEAQNTYADLLDRARAGDPAAFEELARIYEPELRIIARVRLGAALRPHLDTIDLVQSVHRSLLVGLRGGNFDVSTPERLVALALEMVRRKAARKWRHLRRQQRLSGCEYDEPLSERLAALASGESDPAHAAEVQDAMAQVCRNLPDIDRQLLELRLAGYTTVQAARELNQDPDVLRVRLSRLRRRLQERGAMLDWF